MKNPSENSVNVGISNLENLKFSNIVKTKEKTQTSFGKGKIEALKKSIIEIEGMILERQRLRDHVISEAESLKNEIDKYLSENERVQISRDDPSREKTDLRHKRIEISELQMNEKIACWKDVAQLKKEMREYTRELNEKQERLNVLNQIMEDEE